MNEVSIDYLNQLLDERNAWGIIPRECFLAFDCCSNHRIAVDNRTNDFRTEEFEDLLEAQNYLA